MMIITTQRFERWTCFRGVGVAVSLAFLNCMINAVLSVAAHASVIEFFNPDLNNYFITAEPAEQDFVDTGGVGRWLRTGNAFATGGPNQVCRFYGNSFGPNSHFYTANPIECAGLKAIYTPNAKSWNFESNDFLTTSAPSGTCPAGLVPVYRAYNNGPARGVDSNHRITSNYASYLETIAAGSIGEGVVMCAPAGPPPFATPVGVTTGSAVSATIGAAGGSVTAPDSKLVLTIPAGALAANTVISIQPFTNNAPGSSGPAYRLTPEGQTFLKPITLKFTYTDDDLRGTAAGFLGAAFQTAEGFWQWIDDPTVDTAAKTVSVALSHFTVVAEVSKYIVIPSSKTVKTNASLGLTVRSCYGDPQGLANPRTGAPILAADCNFSGNLTQVKPALSVNEWSVNTRLGGGQVFGTVQGNGAEATYKAPSTVPIPNPVSVSARVHDPSKPAGDKQLVSSVITIADDSWTGTATGALLFRTLTIDVTWVLESFANNVAVFTPTGTAGATISDVRAGGCAARFDPAFHSLAPSDGTLTVDYNTDPPTYHGYGLTLWPATLSVISGDCEGSDNIIAGGPFFGGSSGSLQEATGVVTLNGTTIEGSDSDRQSPPDRFSWKFTRQQ